MGFKLTQTSTEFTNSMGSDLQLSKLEPIDLIQKLHEQQELFDSKTVKESLFQSSSNLLDVLDWSSAAIASFPQKSQLPIYLTASDYVKTAQATFYSSMFDLYRIFPQLCSVILHPSVEERMIKIQNIVTQPMNVSDFLFYLQHYFGDYWSGNIFQLNSDDEKNISQWVPLVWNFLAQHLNSGTSRWSNLGNLSLILCQDRFNRCHLKPVSSGKDDVFVRFGAVKIGSVQFNVKGYNDSFQLHSCLTSYQNFVRNFILSDNLTVDQEVNFVHKVSSQTIFGESQKVQLYGHFRDSFCNDQSSISQESFTKLREIPIFEIIPHSYENLLEVIVVYSVPIMLPQAGLSLAKTLADKYVLEESNASGQEFQRRLGIVKMSVEQIYVERIIPLMFHRFEWSDLSKHLEFLNRHMSSLKQKLPLLRCLRECSFIVNQDGERQKASFFYNPQSALFRLFKKGKLLPAKYENFIPLFSQFGFNTNVNQDDFWSFIALYSANESEMSCRVLEHFLKSYDDMRLNSSQFVKIGQLPIFETVRHGHRSLKEVFMSEHKNLVELVHPVLTYGTSVLLKSHCASQRCTFWEIWCSYNSIDYSPKPSREDVLMNLKQNLNLKVSDLDYKVQCCVNYIVFEKRVINDNVLFELSKLACIRSREGNLLPPRQICKAFECPLHPPRPIRMFNQHSSTLLRSEENEQQICELQHYVNEPASTSSISWELLEKLESSKLVTLQQVVYALAQFYLEISPDIWKTNPNLRKKFSDLSDHFFSLAGTTMGAVSALREDCYLYLRTMDVKLHTTNECIVIDDEKLFTQITDAARSDIRSESEIVPPSQVLDLTHRQKQTVARLPPKLRPKFLQDICKLEIDASTYDEQNSTNTDFRSEQILAKLKSEIFLKKLAHVIDYLNIYGNEDSTETGATKYLRDSFHVSKLEKLKHLKLKSVKKLNMRYSFQIRGSLISGVIEKTLEYVDIPEPCFVFAYDQHLDHKKKQKLCNDLTRQLFSKIKCRQESVEAVEVLSELIFWNIDAEAENETLERHEIPPTYEQTPEEPQNDDLIGEIVPHASHALIDYDPSRIFRKDEIVAIKSKQSTDAFFKFGMFKQVKSEGNLSGNPCEFPVFLIRLGRASNQADEVSGDCVFGFKEKLDSTQVDNQNSEFADDDFQRDLENIKQIIHTAITSQQKSGESLDNLMNELEQRFLESYLRKYQDSDKQSTIIRIVKEAIKTQMEARRAQNVSSGSVGDTLDNESGDEKESEAIVQKFIVNNFQRMNQEIQAHREQVAQITSRREERSSRSSNHNFLSYIPKTSRRISGGSSNYSYLDLHRNFWDNPTPIRPLLVSGSNKHKNMWMW